MISKEKDGLVVKYSPVVKDQYRRTMDEEGPLKLINPKELKGIYFDNNENKVGELCVTYDADPGEIEMEAVSMSDKSVSIWF